VLDGQVDRLGAHENLSGASLPYDIKSAILWLLRAIGERQSAQRKGHKKRRLIGLTWHLQSAYNTARAH
jgi:hypothetical protein